MLQYTVIFYVHLDRSRPGMCVCMCDSVWYVAVQCYLPCVARQEQAGYVCVCNNTYCDTVDPPARLKHGHYHLYTTSKDNPGFTHKTGRFHEKKQRLGIDISRGETFHLSFLLKYPMTLLYLYAILICFNVMT